MSKRVIDVRSEEERGEPVYPPPTLANYLAWTDHPAITAHELGRSLATLANIHPGSATVH